METDAMVIQAIKRLPCVLLVASLAFALLLLCSCSCSSNNSAQSKKASSNTAQTTGADSSVAAKYQATVGSSYDQEQAARVAKASPEINPLDNANFHVELVDVNFSDGNRTAIVLYFTARNNGSEACDVNSIVSFTARQSASRDNTNATYVLGAYSGNDAYGNAVPTTSSVVEPGQEASFCVGWYLAEGDFLSIECMLSGSSDAQFYTFDI